MGDRSPGKYSPVGSPITQGGAFEPIVAPELFARVQRKLAKIGRKRNARRPEFPLRGVIYCRHRGEPMHGESVRHKGTSYVYHRYRCPQYTRDHHQRKSDCGHYVINADQVLRWITDALQQMMLGPGREVLTDRITRQLQATARTAPGATRAGEKRLRDLDQQIGRLRRAIAQVNDTGLVEQLRQAKTERERVASELAEAGQFTSERDIEAEATRRVDLIWELGERLGEADPAVLREVIGQLVTRITCEWEKCSTKSGRTRCKFVEGRVELRDSRLWGGGAHAGAWEQVTCKPELGNKLRAYD